MKIDGKKIRDARIKAGLTQQSLGKMIGITQSHLSKIEHNIEKPGLQTLLKAAGALMASVDSLLAP